MPDAGPSAVTDDIEVTEVYEGEQILDADGATLVCTADALRFDGDSVVIPHEDVESVRLDVDKSLSGFTMIGSAFACASVLMTVSFVGAVVLGGGSIVSVAGGGSGLSAILTAYGALWTRRLEVGERRVLQVDCRDGSRSVFVTADDDGLFDEIADRVA